MSEENVEIVRSFLDAFKRGELERALSCYSEDVVFHPLVAGPYYGRQGVVEQMAVFVEEFDDYWFEGEEVIDVKERVVLLWRHGGIGKESGIPVENEGATVFSLKNQSICLARVYSDRAEAMKAAGLSE